MQDKLFKSIKVDFLLYITKKACIFFFYSKAKYILRIKYKFKSLTEYSIFKYFNFYINGIFYSKFSLNIKCFIAKTSDMKYI